MYKSILEVTEAVFKEYVGFAVEAGAFDGLLESPTLELEEVGWKVLLIEPIPEAYSALIKNRNSEYCLQFALGEDNRDGVVFEVSHEAEGACFSSFAISDRMLKAFGDIPKEKTEIFVNKRTLDYCLDLVGFSKVDLVSLDVEGSEMEVLRGFNLRKWKPSVLIIENIFNSIEFKEYLTDYNFLVRLAYNDVFVRKDVYNV